MGGPLHCSLDVVVCRQFAIRLNYLPCLPANKNNVPRVRNGIGRYILSQDGAALKVLLGHPRCIDTCRLRHRTSHLRLVYLSITQLLKNANLETLASCINIVVQMQKISPM